MNQSLTLAFLVAAGIGLVVQNTLMVRITQSSSTILIAMLLNSLVDVDPRPAGVFFCLCQY